MLGLCLFIHGAYCQSDAGQLEFMAWVDLLMLEDWSLREGPTAWKMSAFLLLFVFFEVLLLLRWMPMLGEQVMLFETQI